MEAILSKNDISQDEVQSLKDEIQNLRLRLAEAEELRRAINDGDLDALVIPGSKGEMIFTLESADRAYRVLVETMNEGTATIAYDGTILYCNHHFAELMNMPSHAIVGTSIYHFVDPADRINFETLLEQEMGKDEINFRTEKRAILPAYLSISSLKVEGSPNAWCLVITDLTEKKKNEETLANIETIRKKEIHHRIKNNLQVISSLLDLQAEKFNNRKYIEDSEVLEAFRESQDRVTSIALIHEELHEEEGTNDTLNFSLYLQRLTENLFQTYRLGNSDINLNLNLEENIFFDMDTAVPLGMIVNELVSNSLKYAFPDTDKGEIQIRLFGNRVKNDRENLTGKYTQYTLIVSDNGVGISENIDFENTDTLGLQLVNILLDQLDGKIELKRDKGTQFIISFSVEE
jgi:PAS domain S-box-containing protein